MSSFEKDIDNFQETFLQTHTFQFAYQHLPFHLKGCLSHQLSLHKKNDKPRKGKLVGYKQSSLPQLPIVEIKCSYKFHKSGIEVEFTLYFNEEGQYIGNTTLDIANHFFNKAMQYYKDNQVVNAVESLNMTKNLAIEDDELQLYIQARRSMMTCDFNKNKSLEPNLMSDLIACNIPIPDVNLLENLYLVDVEWAMFYDVTHYYEKTTQPAQSTDDEKVYEMYCACYARIIHECKAFNISDKYFDDAINALSESNHNASRSKLERIRRAFLELSQFYSEYLYKQYGSLDELNSSNVLQSIGNEHKEPETCRRSRFHKELQLFDYLTENLFAMLPPLQTLLNYLNVDLKEVDICMTQYIKINEMYEIRSLVENLPELDQQIRNHFKGLAHLESYCSNIMEIYPNTSGDSTLFDACAKLCASNGLNDGYILMKDLAQKALSLNKFTQYIEDVRARFENDTGACSFVYCKDYRKPGFHKAKKFLRAGNPSNVEFLEDILFKCKQSSQDLLREMQTYAKICDVEYTLVPQGKTYTNQSCNKERRFGYVIWYCIPLSEVLNNRHSEVERKQIAIRCAEIVQYLHDKGYVWVSMTHSSFGLRRGKIFGIDFELTTNIDAVLECNDISYNYRNLLAPEVAIGKLISPSMDIWSLGLIFISILANTAIEYTNVNYHDGLNYCKNILTVEGHGLISSMLQEDPGSRPNIHQVLKILEHDPLIHIIGNLPLVLNELLHPQYV